jgi:hypothetical protein
MAGSTRRDDVQEAHLEAQNAKPNDLTAEPMLGSKKARQFACVLVMS